MRPSWSTYVSCALRPRADLRRRHALRSDDRLQAVRVMRGRDRTQLPRRRLHYGRLQGRALGIQNTAFCGRPPTLRVADSARSGDEKPRRRVRSVSRMWLSEVRSSARTAAASSDDDRRTALARYDDGTARTRPHDLHREVQRVSRLPRCARDRRGPMARHPQEDERQSEAIARRVDDGVALHPRCTGVSRRETAIDFCGVEGLRRRLTL